MKRFESLNYVEGSPPKNASEASLDTQTADRGNLDVGDTLNIAGDGSLKKENISFGGTTGGGLGRPSSAGQA
jgi:hypothetical protein